MGGNIPTYFLVQPKGIISCKTSSREDSASNRVNKPLHLVKILLATGSSESFSKIDTKVDIQLLQVNLQFPFANHYLIHYYEVFKLVPILRKRYKQRFL